jgi:hypothetical protein
MDSLKKLSPQPLEVVMESKLDRIATTFTALVVSIGMTMAVVGLFLPVGSSNEPAEAAMLKAGADIPVQRLERIVITAKRADKATLADQGRAERPL